MTGMRRMYAVVVSRMPRQVMRIAGSAPRQEVRGGGRWSLPQQQWRARPRRVEWPESYARRPENTIFTIVSASWSTVPERSG